MSSNKPDLPVSRLRFRERGETVARLAAIVFSALAIAAPAASAAASGNAPSPASADPAAVQARLLLSDANQFWSQTFTRGGSYSPAQVTLFKHDARGTCGETEALTGPFYCFDDMTVYLDRDFLDQIGQRLSGDAADYAFAYVIGHELGLHIQNLVGTTNLVQEARSNSGPKQSARTWMTAELQADCYAGLWMRSAVSRHQVRAVPDANAVLTAVAAVSTDWRSHLKAGETMADSLLTYGTAAQRLQWFQRGLDSGRFNDCDTFKAEAAGKL